MKSINYNYDYSKLKGLIKENFGNLSDYARYIGISTTSLNERLNNRLPFKQDEMEKSIIGFSIKPDMIDDLFFCKLNTENRIKWGSDYVLEKKKENKKSLINREK